jgi:hypothetical protein
MTALPRKARILILCALAAACLIVTAFIPPVAQDPAYHDFADQRGWLGIPNFGDVAGNVFFLLSGLWGLIAALHPKTSRGWLVFFGGVFLTGIGSAYYHLAPGNQRLVWDRLPMTIAFMSLFSLLIAERIGRKAGTFLFPFLLAAGAASVWYWNWTESLGHGDLRPYAFVQFFPMLAIGLILALFPAQHGGTRYLLCTLAWYVAAKLLEHYDHAVFDLTGQIVSGHTLKHIAAATGAACMTGYMKEARS